MRRFQTLIPWIMFCIVYPSSIHGWTVARADFNGDLQVDMFDLLDFHAAFYSTEIKYDLDESGRVDFIDFLALAKHWEQKVPLTEEFNFIFSYGYDARNQFNTLSEIYTKDMVIDPSTSTKLTLLQSEMDSIHQRMLEIDFFNYPGKLIPIDTLGIGGPASTVRFVVIENYKVKTMEWKNDIISNDARIDPLRELIQLIRRFIESKEEYKNLPTPRAAYL